MPGTGSETYIFMPVSDLIFIHFEFIGLSASDITGYGEMDMFIP